MFAPVTRVETPDPHTVIIKLSQPHPAILLAMSPPFLPILPEHIYGDGQDIASHPANLEPIGSGPFKFISYTPNDRIVLERYENYFIPGRPYLDRIEFWIDVDPASQVVDLERQVAHITSTFIDLPGLDHLNSNEHLEITRSGYEAVGPLNWLAFNLLRPPLDQVLVRQAIAYAIDLDFISEYLHQGRSQRALGPIAPGSPFYEPGLPDYAYDPQKAARLLDQAGYPLKEDGSRFSLTLDYVPVIPSQQHDVAYYIQYQLSKVGIEVHVRDSATFPEWADRIGNWDFDMTMDGVYNWGDPVIGVHRSYMSDNIRQGVVWSNTQNYSNKIVDDIFSQAAVELDFEKRKALYAEFQLIVTEELPVVWINEFPYHTIYHRGLGNPPLTIWGVHSPLDEIYWREPLQKEYIQTNAKTDISGLEPLVMTGMKAITLLQDLDFYEARNQLEDPEGVFLEVEKSGLHVIGFTRGGKIFLDGSGQFTDGMDISALLDLEGDPVLPILIELAESKSSTPINLDGFKPNPSTQKADPMSVWCGLLTVEEIVCILAWEQVDGGEK
jgi:peptide/nickel transport system substrate-binding protein